LFERAGEGWGSEEKIFAEAPLKAEYSLTEKGASLREIIHKMHEWGEQSG
jgi:DNA-binding HxlR family transcriptional regulator